MTIRAVAGFDVTSWDQHPYDDGTPGPHLSRATVRKTLRGDLVEESTTELLMCQADPAALGHGAGYVASEHVVGALGGRSGTFVLQHWGISGGGGPQVTAGHVVPGSGTGELVGLSGRVEVSLDANGGHTLTLDYAIT